MIKFQKIPDPKNKEDHTTVTISTHNDDITHTELAEIFNEFLRGMGYSYDGEYELVSKGEEVIKKLKPAEKVLYKLKE